MNVYRCLWLDCLKWLSKLFQVLNLHNISWLIECFVELVSRVLMQTGLKCQIHSDRTFQIWNVKPQCYLFLPQKKNDYPWTLTVHITVNRIQTILENRCRPPVLPMMLFSPSRLNSVMDKLAATFRQPLIYANLGKLSPKRRLKDWWKIRGSLRLDSNGLMKNGKQRGKYQNIHFNRQYSNASIGLFTVAWKVVSFARKVLSSVCDFICLITPVLWWYKLKSPPPLKCFAIMSMSKFRDFQKSVAFMDPLIKLVISVDKLHNRKSYSLLVTAWWSPQARETFCSLRNQQSGCWVFTLERFLAATKLR